MLPLTPSRFCTVGVCVLPARAVELYPDDRPSSNKTDVARESSATRRGRPLPASRLPALGPGSGLPPTRLHGRARASRCASAHLTLSEPLWFPTGLAGQYLRSVTDCRPAFSPRGGGRFRSPLLCGASKAFSVTGSDQGDDASWYSFLRLALAELLGSVDLQASPSLEMFLPLISQIFFLNPPSYRNVTSPMPQSGFLPLSPVGIPLRDSFHRHAFKFTNLFYDVLSAFIPSNTFHVRRPRFPV